MPIREQQITNKQHAIPQSIMSVEFKIIGDLTLKQFFYLLVFCGLAYGSFMVIQASIFKWFFVIFFVIIGLCFAFLPLGDRGLDVWVVNFFRAMFLPNQFVYRKQEAIPNVFLYQNLDMLKSELITLTPTVSRRKIEAYLEQQVIPIDRLDYDEKSYILKVREAYGSYYGDYGATPAPVTTSTTVIEELPVTPPPPTAQPFIQTPIQPPVQEKGAEIPTSEPVKKEEFVAPAPEPVSQTLSRLEIPEPQPWRKAPEISHKIEIRPTEPQITVVPEIPQAEPVQAARLEENAIKSRATFGRYNIPKKQERSDDYYSPSMTPDMHVGRKFMNLAQELGGGEIILPIRGERVFKVMEQPKTDPDEELKLKQLGALMEQIRSSQPAQQQVAQAQQRKEADMAIKRQLAVETQRVKEREERKGQDELIRNRQEKEREEREKKEAELRQKIVADRRPLGTTRIPEVPFQNQTEIITQSGPKVMMQPTQPPQPTQSKRSTQHTTVIEPLESLEPLEPVQPAPKVEAQAILPSKAVGEESPAIPNIIWGVVMSGGPAGKTAVPGVVVVIRNQRKEVVRAVKTNPQGRFSITNPLIDGSYTIEVDNNKTSGLNFNIISIDAKGKIIPTVEIVGSV